MLQYVRREWQGCMQSLILIGTYCPQGMMTSAWRREGPTNVSYAGFTKVVYCCKTPATSRPLTDTSLCILQHKVALIHNDSSVDAHQNYRRIPRRNGDSKFMFHHQNCVGSLSGSQTRIVTRRSNLRLTSSFTKSGSGELFHWASPKELSYVLDSLSFSSLLVELVLLFMNIAIHIPEIYLLARRTSSSVSTKIFMFKNRRRDFILSTRIPSSKTTSAGSTLLVSFDLWCLLKS